MEKKKQSSYNFSSVDLLIYIWSKRLMLGIVGFVAAVAAIIISITITPMFQASVIMFPTSGSSVARELLSQNYGGRYSLYGFGEENQAEQLLQVLHSEPIRTRIIEKYDLMEHYEIDPEGKYPRTELMNQYNSNINFRLTEFMSVEINVMDKDPILSAAIANDICDLVDTVYNSMKKIRAVDALDLVKAEFVKAEEQMLVMQDSVNIIAKAFSKNIPANGSSTNDLARAFADYGINYLTLLRTMQYEGGMVNLMRHRYNEAKMEAEQNLPHKFIVERAIPPEKKAYPNKSLIVIVSTLAALLFALIILIITDNIQARVAAMKEE